MYDQINNAMLGYKNKKYFYSYEGEGLRYEIHEFISMIINNRMSSYRLRRSESILIATIIDSYRKGKYVNKLS